MTKEGTIDRIIFAVATLVTQAVVAQSVVRRIGSAEVTSSILVSSSVEKALNASEFLVLRVFAFLGFLRFVN